MRDVKVSLTHFLDFSNSTWKIFCKYHCGFRKDQSKIDQIQYTREIPEKTSEYGISKFHLFVV